MFGIIRALGALVLPGGAADDKATKPGPPIDPESGTAYTVLAIDDDATYLQLERTALKEAGYNVLSTISPSKGLDMLRYAPSKVRVVLLDFDMPRLNGLEALVHLRKLNPTLKIVAVTGVDSKFLPADFCAGVDQLVTKPVRMQDLVNLVGQLTQPEPALATSAA